MTTIRRRVPRPTIRTRLAAVYALVFLVAGGALLGVTYALMHDAISKQQISLAVLSDADFTTARADPTAERQRLEKIELYQQMVRDDFRREVVNSMTRSLAVALVVLVFVGFGFGWFVARHSLRPVQQITDAARRVAGGRFEERVALSGPRDEIRELADTFDDMVRRLAAAFDSQRRFVANASHELRTPLTINRTLLEVAMGRPDSPAQLRELGAALLQVNERQHAMIDGLLALAESEQRLAGTVPVDLGELIRVSVRALQPEADQRGITVIVGEIDASVDADPELLERLTMNLVQNAIRHNRARRSGVGVLRCDAGRGRASDREHRALRTGGADTGTVRAVPSRYGSGRVAAWPRAGSVDRASGRARTWRLDQCPPTRRGWPGCRGHAAPGCRSAFRWCAAGTAFVV